MNSITAQLRDSLIIQADAAFLSLASNVDILLDLTEFFAEHQVNPHTLSGTIKTAQLKVAVKELGPLLKRVGSEIESWNNNEERLQSRLGVELQLLNELYITIEALALFFIRENIGLRNFSLDTVRQSYHELIRCNRLL